MGEKVKKEKGIEGKMMSRVKSAAIMMILMVLVLSPQNVFARSMIDTGHKCSMVIDYNYPGGIDIPNAEFRVYRVGDVDEYACFTATSEYSGYPVDYDAMESPEDWNALAYTLQGYIDRDGKKPLATVTTGSDGTVKLDNLKTGLYLVLGGGTLYNKYTYTPVPTLVMLPEAQFDENGKETNEWLYDVTMSPKVDRVATPDKLTVEVKKVWKNTDGVSHPESVSVDLYRNGEKFDTAVLNEKNGWKHSWDGLDANYEVSDNKFKAYTWSVAEQSIDDYDVVVSKSGDCFVVTNTFTGTLPSDDKLPQTGLLWWPVPVLLAAGVLLILAGAVRARKE